MHRHAPGTPASVSTAPEGRWLGGRLEAGCLHHPGGLLESGRDHGRAVCVASDRHRGASELTPPAEDRLTWTQDVAARGVHLEHELTLHCGRENGAQLLLEVLLAISRP